MRRKFRNTFPGILKVLSKSRSWKGKQIVPHVWTFRWKDEYLKNCVGHTSKRPFVSYGIYSEHVHSPLLRVFQNLNITLKVQPSFLLKMSFKGNKTDLVRLFMKRSSCTDLGQLWLMLGPGLHSELWQRGPAPAAGEIHLFFYFT